MYKKINLTPILKRGLHRHIYKLSMKLALLLLFVGTAHASAPTFGQSITLKRKNAKLSSILKDIQRQSGYNIFYDASVVSKDLLATVNLTNQPLDKTLETLLKGYSLDYKIVDKNIILRSLKTNNAAQTANSDAAQTTIEGNIISENGQQMPNVSILEKGTTNSVRTDENGHFKIAVSSSNAVLVFTYLGYQKQEISINNRTTINVSLTPLLQELSEVVVVGYGTQKKVNLTGAVSSVSMDALGDRPVTNATSALAGLAAGLSVTNTGGSTPGYESQNIRIRGQGTLNNSSPLIVIDGMTGGSISDVNPQDIATISVLKDAASSSIYGSRGANGVILITTKKGTEGTSKITYSGNVAAETVAKRLNLVTDYADFMDIQNAG